MSERVTIAALGHRGDGVASTAGGDLYVPCTLPGETVEVRAIAGKDRADVVRILTPSADRVPPPCPHFGVCGGCALQHMRDDAYRAWKRDLVVSALRGANIDAPVDDLVPAHGAGRRRATFHARRGTHDILSVGFMAARAHQVVPITVCPILGPALAGALPAAWAIAERLAGLKTPLDIQVTASDSGLDIDVRGARPLDEPTRSALAALAARFDLARLTRHGELVAQRRAPTLTIGRASVVLPPGAFLQATAAGETALARLVEEMSGPAKAVADLFCGVGTFALRLAERARISAVDGEASALAALDKAARSTAGLKPIVTAVRDLFRRPLLPRELEAHQAVVFDPPRQGAEAQARRLAESKVGAIVAVSCNPATFARDAAILVAGGYRLERVVPVDQFLYSAHVELVARFVRP